MKKNINWRVERVCTENGAVKEVVFLINEISRVGIKLGPEGGLKKKIWGNKEFFSSKKFPWKEINLEARKRLGVKNCLPRPRKTSLFCEETARLKLEAEKFNKEIEAEAALAKYKNRKLKYTAACQKILKDSLKIKMVSLRGFPPAQRLNLILLNCFGIMALEEGWLGLSRWFKLGEKFKIRRQKTPDLYSAIRMQEHILKKYKYKNQGEISKLHSIKKIILDCNELLLKWKTAKPQNKSAIKRKLITSILSLKYCRNEFKQVIKDQLSLILPWRDKTGRINPGALAARTITGLNELHLRLKEIEIIEPYIALRHELLIYLEQWQKELVMEATKLIKQKRIKLAVKILSIAVISPYREQAEQAKFWLENCLLEKTCDHPRRYLATAIEILQDDLSPEAKIR
ncbi:MAG: hypothetical protein WCV70_04755 [Patescibacteria group bacterium]|jgi:hypothetical protein